MVRSLLYFFGGFVLFLSWGVHPMGGYHISFDDWMFIAYSIEVLPFYGWVVLNYLYSSIEPSSTDLLSIETFKLANTLFWPVGLYYRLI